MRVMVIVGGIMMAGAASAADMPVTPGKWQITTTVESMSMPGLPPSVAASMLKKPIVVSSCVSADAAANGPRDLIAKTNGSCRYTRYNISGGRIDAAMQCTGAGPQTIAIAGTFTADAYDIRSQMSGAQMTSTAHAVGKRIGPC